MSIKSTLINTLLICVLSVGFLIPQANALDCFDIFSIEFWDAYDEYQQDLRYCKSVVVGSKFCIIEAELAYELAVEDAIRNFEICCCDNSLLCCR